VSLERVVDTREFFIARFPDLWDNETIEIRPIHATSGKHHPRSFCTTPAGAAAAVERVPEGFEVYYGVNPRRGRDGTKEGVSRITCVFADADDKHFGDDPAAAREAVMAFELIPTGMIRSGHGWQPYWALSEPLDNTPANRDLVETLQRRLYLRLGGLDAVQDIGRILRVPGTTNHKDPQSPLPVSVDYWEAGRTYSPADFDPYLPPLIKQEVTYRETTAVYTEGERPSLETMRTLLSYVSPVLPYGEHTAIWAAVAYYFPGPEGLSLVDEWSTAAREAAGQYSTARSQPEKHDGFRRQTGRVATLGTLIHYAKLGGWEPPKTPLNLVTRGKRGKRATEERLEELPNPPVDELPYWLQELYTHLGPLTEGLPRDLVTVTGLTALSILWPGIRFENLPLSLFCNLVMEQGSGKSKITTELERIVKAIPDQSIAYFTAGSPQGMYSALAKSESSRMYASFDEFGDFLSTLKNDYMSGTRGNLNSLYDGRDIHHNLARTSTTIRQPYVTLVAGTTPRMFFDNVTPADLEGGFASRFWYLAPWWEDRGVHDYPTTEARTILANRLGEHVAAHAHVTAARFDGPTGIIHPLYAAYEAELGIGTGVKRGIREAIETPLIPRGRYTARVKRVAANLELLDRRPHIQHNVVIVRDAYLRLAIVLVSRCGVYADLILELLAVSEDEQALVKLRRALARKPEGLSRSELLQFSHIKAQDLNRLLPILAENDECEEIQMGHKTLWRAPGGPMNLRLVQAAD
jgi:hypothetical protein